MQRIIMLFIVAGTIGAPATVLGQRADVIERGAKIRVSMTGKPSQVGYLDSLSTETIGLRLTEPNSGSAYLARTQVVGFEVRRKSRVRGALKGGLIGLAAGTVSGFLLGALTYEDSDCFFVCSPAQAGMVVGIVGAVIVTPIGIVGGAVTGAGTWKRVDPASATMR